MPLKVPIAHDFICPWCWVGLLQALRMKSEFGVELEWLSYELLPAELEWPESSPALEIPNKPKLLSRFEFLLQADGMQMPGVDRPKRMRSHNAHEAVEYVKSACGDVDAFVEVLYRALWERGEAIDSLEVLKPLAKPFVSDLQDFEEAVKSRRFASAIIGFDVPAYRSGVFNVPTFFIHGERYAEQPYSVLAAVLGTPQPYAYLHFPPASMERPYVYINMVATIDGKILSGSPENGQVELGSRTDRETMRRIEAPADAILIGANTLRHTSPKWTPSVKHRVVLTRSGQVDPAHGFFRGGQGWVAGVAEAPEGLDLLPGTEPLEILKSLREIGVERLLILGGSEVNAQFLKEDLADELFLTLAPKVKLGRDIPTYADGDPLPADGLLEFELVESHQVESELFLRYRRRG